MRRFLLLIVVVFAVSCYNHNSQDAVIEDGTTLTISIQQTRTSLGAKEGDTYPTYWSQGDKIVVNGRLSDEVQIDNSNKSLANFHFSGTALSYPYYITYPYCKSTTSERPVVEFSAEQEYATKSFSSGSAPMCGYANSASNKIVLCNLSTILHIPIKSAREGVVLEKVVVTATNNIAGEFYVDCQNATISESENCTNVLTYNLPANFALSTTTASDLFIALPAVEVGTCKVEFFEVSGKKMVANWTPKKPLTSGIVREFNTTIYDDEVSCELGSLGSYEDEFELSFKKYANSKEIKIMSFNIRTYTTETDPQNNWENRQSACIELIKDQRPSIIGFQEAQYTLQWKVVKDALADDYDGYGVNRTDGSESGNGEVMGILYNKKTIKKIDGGTFWLSETPETPSKGFGATYARNATWGIFEHIPTGVKFYYINTHLDHQVANAQIEGMKLIASYFNNYKDTYPLFLTGDLNIKSDNVALDVIEDFMYNTRDAAPDVLTDYNTTFNGYKTNKNSIIDHIYCSKEMEVVEYHTINRTYNNVTFVSDHYPIYAIIKLE